ncbi:Glyceraldehyde 3-phosphate dehydrogenase [gamma proteobacterium HdN1]|nr:Glyceraldehyde 3-phosphate dehydrogenase [gamma proteobacterium HdN1]
MALRIAINGYGRIGRNVLRAIYECGYRKEIEIVAINDLGDVKVNAHLTRFDSVHGPFSGKIDEQSDSLVVNGDQIRVFAEKSPTQLPWNALGVDMVFECSGKFTSKEKCQAHFDAGAKTVQVSAPATQADATIVYGVNHSTLTGAHRLISTASCTTNCLAPMAHALHANVGIMQGMMTTIHAFTNDQVLLDMHHKDLRRARSAHLSMIPTKTGAAAAVGLVLPELSGRLDGMAIRVPTANVSLVDLVFTSARPTTKDEINEIMKKAADTDTYGILEYNALPLVSIDFNHHAASCIFDSTQTRAEGTLVKAMAWYDNEWGFSLRMLDICRYMGQQGLL